MMKKVLFVDYTYQKGHVNFNQIHVSALRAKGYNVKLVLHKSLAAQLPFCDSDYAMFLPEILKQREGHPFINRVAYIVALLLIKIKNKISSYDKVIISSCDEITLGLVPLCKGMYIICHYANSFKHSLKRFFLKRLAVHNSFIVFNKTMALSFNKNGIDNVFVISHGCMPSYDLNSLENTELLIDTSQYAGVIFHPSANPDTDFIRCLTTDKMLKQFLSSSNILLVLRNQPNGITYTSNIIFINEYLSQQQYRKLFLLSDIILLAYPPTFEYRVSGVSFECVANGKKALIRYNRSFEYCKDFFNYDPMFHDVSELCSKIQYLMTHPNARCVVTPSSLVPDYDEILKK